MIQWLVSSFISPAQSETVEEKLEKLQEGRPQL